MQSALYYILLSLSPWSAQQCEIFTFSSVYIRTTSELMSSHSLKKSSLNMIHVGNRRTRGQQWAKITQHFCLGECHFSSWCSCFTTWTSEDLKCLLTEKSNHYFHHYIIWSSCHIIISSTKCQNNASHILKYLVLSDLQSEA